MMWLYVYYHRLDCTFRIHEPSMIIFLSTLVDVTMMHMSADMVLSIKRVR